MSSGSRKILLVDDHTLFRNGLRTLLNTVPGLEVSGEASDGREMLDALVADMPDIVLLDIEMPVMNGIAAAEEALRRYPELKVIILSMYGEEDYYFKMVSLGVKGFLLKNSRIDEVTEAINTVLDGGTFFSRELLANIVGNLRPGAGAARAKEPVGEILSERELEILLHICRGESNNEIADALFISKRTVDKHRSNILAKTGCKNTANLVMYAIRHNLVQI